MSGNFIGGVSPMGFIVIVFVVLFVVEFLAFRSGQIIRHPKSEAAMSALTTALAAIFGIVALVLSFSFSFALARYEQRWQLVVQEANDIGTLYLRTSVLDTAPGDELRSLLRAYTQDRIDYYKSDNDPAAQQRDQTASAALQDRMWTIVSQAMRTNPRQLGVSLLMQVTNDTIDISAEQRAALNFRLRGSALALVFLVALLGALALGLVFGYTDFRNWLVSTIFSLLLTMLVYTIIDLDSPQSGFVRVNLTPLYEQQKSMIPQLSR
jgi:hypothetical protein